MIVTILVVLLTAAGLAFAGVRLVRVLRAELHALRADAAQQLTERNADVDRRLEAMTATMDRRLETATKTTSAIHQQLGQLGQANAEILARANDLKKLEQALRPPKARGGFGELLLGNLLRDRLPQDSYQLQYGFKTGERVDAVIRVERLVPIDAKFPLDNFERMIDAGNDVEREQHAKAFARDVKGHVDAIASKYIRPEENTYDFAFMYFPSEAIYYELACGKTGALLTYANENRVFPVSPTTLTAYLQVVALGLRGMQIEQHAREVMEYVAELDKDFVAFRDDFLVVGKHLANAQGRYVDAQRRLDRFDAKLERAVEHEVLDADELPQALDAA